MILVSILVKAEMKGLDVALRRVLILMPRKAELDEKLGYPFLCSMNAEAYPVSN